MKILLVIEATLGGTARHILDLAEGFVTRGHEVHLVYSLVRGDRSFRVGLAKLAEMDRFHGHEIPMDRGVRVRDLRALFSLWTIVQQHGPFDVVHSHSTKAGFLTRLLPIQARFVSLYTPHAMMTEDPNLGGWRRAAVTLLEKTLARRNDRIIVVSESERLGAIAVGLPAEKVVVVPNGLNPQAAAAGARRWARETLGLPDDTVCIGTVGLLVENKEHARLVRSFALLRQQTSRRVKLVIIGWGPMETSLRRLAAQLKIEDSVQFLGEVRALDYMPAFDVLTHPSRYESFAYTLVEALQHGVPVVTSRVGATNDLVIPELTGFVCDPWDDGKCATYLRRLVEDDELRIRLGRAGRELAQAFTADAMVTKTLDVYALKPASEAVSAGAASREVV